MQIYTLTAEVICAPKSIMNGVAHSAHYRNP